MAEILIRPATDADAVALAPDLREADRLEIEAASGDAPLDALRRSLARSSEAWAATTPEGIIALWGVGPLSLLGGHGAPWLLGSDLVARHAFAVARRNRPTVRRWLTMFPLLSNWVDARNALSVRWLRWIGFTILPPVPYGVARLPFHPFELRRADV
ncbi:MAG: hypothetical protein KF889_25390 [Alphaproteobacteria bacterium]|nr:hypothetical protein [Alphaproteobacteria bacterium]MCW5739672.1 hypothetical protein [Alphaproteobacteria bacterium]